MGRRCCSLSLVAALAACAGPRAPAPASVPRLEPATAAAAHPARPRTPDARPARRVVTVSSEIEILDPIGFTGNTAALAPTALRTLDAVVRTLADNPNILLLEVRGHSDSLLHPADRADLARDRAEAVAAYLIAHGIDPSRVRTYGASDSELLYAPDDARNRRVELLIVDRGD